MNPEDLQASQQATGDVKMPVPAKPRPDTPKAIRKWVVVAMLVIGLVSLAWAFRFKFDRLKDTPVRINRFTGKTEVLWYWGWVPLGERRSEPSVPSVDVPKSEVAKLTGHASITSYGWIKVEIYNGSTFNIDRLTVAVAVPEDAIRQEYELYPRSGAVEPKNAGGFHAGLGFKLNEGKQFQWSILSAKGTAQKDVFYESQASESRKPGTKLYEIKCPDGRIFDVESDHSPTMQEIREILTNYQSGNIR